MKDGIDIEGGFVLRQFYTYEDLEIVHKAELELLRAHLGHGTAGHRAVIDEVCIKHSISKTDLMGHPKLRKIARARFEAWARIYEIKGTTGTRRFSLGGIADMFCRDHTTILHGIRRAHELGLVEGATECSN